MSLDLSIARAAALTIQRTTQLPASVIPRAETLAISRPGSSYFR
jgi:hypothetical protein